MKLHEAEFKFLGHFSSTIIPALKKEADLIAQSYFKHDFDTLNKPGLDKRDKLDVVTRLDQEVESRLYDLLHSNFPELGFDVEEHKQWQDKAKDFTCYLDPIDGTKYFARQIPLFSTQVALSYQGEPIFGMVINPLTKETYIGSEINPSSRNNVPIKISGTSKLSESFVNVGIVPFRPLWDREKEWIFQKLLLLEQNTYRVRKIGSSALILSWVAQGGFDAAIFLVADPDYDTMAGQALIKYAGGMAEKVVIPDIKEPRLICANKELFEQIKQHLLA